MASRIQGLCSLWQISLAGGRAILSIDAHLGILLGRIGQNLTSISAKRADHQPLRRRPAL